MKRISFSAQSNAVYDLLMKFRKITVKEHFVFWLSKIGFYGIFIALPIILIGPWPALLGFIVMAVFCGITLGIVFQLAHVVEQTNFPITGDSFRKINKEWAVHQLNTTANFSTKSKIISWFAGGLNFQVEHHLFPQISHVHYPALSRFVKETCDQLKIKYIEYPSFFSALRSHILHLKKTGVK